VLPVARKRGGTFAVRSNLQPLKRPIEVATNDCLQALSLISFTGGRPVLASMTDPLEAVAQPGTSH